MTVDPQEEYSLINNLVPSSYANILEDELSKTMPWYYTPSSSGEVKVDKNDKNVVDVPQMHHVFLESDGTTSPYFPLIQPLVWFVEQHLQINIKSLNRIKANLLQPGSATLTNYNIPHIDHPADDHISMIYYVHDADGDTRIFDKTIDQGHEGLNCIGQFNPVKGRALVFKSNRFHASAPPVNATKRMIINFVLQIG
jgi:hypothetical protein